MASAKITELDEITPVATDVLPIVDDPAGTPVTSKTTVQSILDLVPAPTAAQLDSLGPMPGFGQTGFTIARGLSAGGIAAMVAAGCTLLQPSVSGTTNNASDQTDGSYWLLQTGATATNAAGLTAGSSAYTQTRWEPQWDLIVRSPEVLTSTRLWLGLCSTSFTDSDVGTGHIAAFRFSSVTSDTGWMPCTRNNSDTTVGTAIGTVEADTVYHLRIRVANAGASVFFSVDGGAEQELTATLPTTTQGLGPDARTFTQTNAARNFKFGRMRLVWGTEP